MDKPTIYKLLRCLVCLILVCCILINCSPVRSKATSLVAGLTVAEVVGYLALIVGVPVGAVFIADTVEKVAAVGQEIIDVWIDEDAAAQGALEYAEDLTSNINGMWENGDGSGYDPRLGTKLARGLLAAIAAMVGASIVDGAMNVEVEEEVEADEGKAFFDINELPIIDSYISGSQSYAVIIKDGDFYYLYTSEQPIIQGYSFGFGYPDDYSYRTVSASKYTLYRTSGGSWSKWSSGSLGLSMAFSGSVLWANHDILKVDCQSSANLVYGEVAIAGSEPSRTSTQTIPVTLPPLYVGDIPAEIQDPDLTEDERTEKILAPLPDQIDITKVIKSPETALQDVTAWQQQVVDGVKSLEQSVEDIKADLDDTVDPDPTVPGTDPDTGTDTEKEVGDFTLDLTNYFPFCIPFDLYDFFACLNADPVTPVIEWEIYLPGGDVYPLTLDLSPFDSVAQLLRRLQLLLFCVGLAFKTRDLIKG